VDRWRVLDDDHILALQPTIAEFGDCCRRIREQAGSVRRIGPRLRHHPGAVARADLALIALDDGVERRRIDQPLFGEQRFERLDAQRRVRQRRVMAVVVTVLAHPVVSSSTG